MEKTRLISFNEKQGKEQYKLTMLTIGLIFIAILGISLLAVQFIPHNKLTSEQQAISQAFSLAKENNWQIYKICNLDANKCRYGGNIDYVSSTSQEKLTSFLFNN